MDNQQKLEQLKVLYDEMSQHTHPECGKCRLPFSCCSAEYCEIAIELAAEQKVVLERTDHPTLPLMGPHGCTAPPHLRPICTVHTCDINNLGFKRDDPGGKWTKRYFELRDRINDLENELRRW